ncbi:MAG: aspartate--ammonia ligase [Clostridiales bacterium]|nr:aspartate--ammonia ligase [Clostridiales bacterium]
MHSLRVPPNYRPLLTLYETQEGIALIKHTFTDFLSKALNLKRVSAPLFVEAGSGLNDDLSGVERPVSFEVRDSGEEVQVVHSLAKWKRQALKRYGFPVGEGLYTDMNAIRRDEELDNLHSIYVDQWDWEKVITDDQRSLDTLKDAMQNITTAIICTYDLLRWKYPRLKLRFKHDMTFATAQELEDRWPQLTPKQREEAFTRQHRSVGILQIGGRLRSGQPHDGRAPDYDDWQLNGDILFWHETLGCAMELSSMGIRVDPDSLALQLRLSGCEDRRQLPFHRSLLAGELPPAMGGGIGQSRMCMLLMGKAHIGEVQSSHWDSATRAACAQAGIFLL